MDNLRNKLKKINMVGEIRFDEPMNRHTTFKTGGPADIFIIPSGTEELRQILNILKAGGDMEDIFVLGGGANLLVSDEGIRGVVIETSLLDEIKTTEEGILTAGAGAGVDSVAEAALGAGLSGFDSFYGMPGSIGGAVWMNARCYGSSISDILSDVSYINDEGHLLKTDAGAMTFDYKVSPFQQMKSIIIEASFRLRPGNRKEIEHRMTEHRTDREKKGHYAAPCAGSVFKNNRAFGKPSGMIIDSLGLRGFTIGKAAVSEKHANIIVNLGGASSADIFRLVMYVRDRVREAYGFELEPEIQFIGNFPAD